ncbi:hypothetical protein ACFLYI_00960 [Chloroflexota bacterium]
MSWIWSWWLIDAELSDSGEYFPVFTSSSKWGSSFMNFSSSSNEDDPPVYTASEAEENIKVYRGLITRVEKEVYSL